MRWSTLMTAGVLLVTGVFQPLQAQEEREERQDSVCIAVPRIRAETWSRGGEFGNWPQVVWVGGRARLGVYVNTRANEDTDRYGALINGVTDGGPADKAGIQKDDIITRLNGASLLQGDEEYDEDESAPGMRLIERARELEVGDTVTVEYRRDGETKTTELVIGDFEGRLGVAWSGGVPESWSLAESFGRLRQLPEISVRGPESFALRLGAALPGLELTSLNPDLGQYFGTEEGVLVVSVPEDNELQLKSGDVILQIDGRQVRSPSHAMRILRSYEPDEEVTLRIMRRQRAQNVTGKIPDLLGTSPRVIIERNDSE